MFVILFLVVTVAAFNIVSTLVMVVADRTREIGILKSMGMTDSRIQKIFVSLDLANVYSLSLWLNTLSC